MKRKKYMWTAEVVKGRRLMWIAGKFLVMMVLFFLAVYFCIEGQQAAKTVTVILNGKALEYDQAVLICEQKKIRPFRWKPVFGEKFHSRMSPALQREKAVP